MTKRRFLATITGACLLAGPGIAKLAAAPINFADRVACQKIEDTAPHGRYSAEVASNFLGLQAGCIIKLPAKLLCVPSITSSIDPPPPGAPPGTNLVLDNYQLCYKLKCPKSVLFLDQFVAYDALGGARLVRVKAAKLFCTPGS